jgi:hypothetical protein
MSTKIETAQEALDATAKLLADTAGWDDVEDGDIQDFAYPPEDADAPTIAPQPPNPDSLPNAEKEQAAIVNALEALFTGDK